MKKIEKAQPKVKVQKEAKNNVDKNFLILVVLIAAGLWGYKEFGNSEKDSAPKAIPAPAKTPINLIVDHKLFFKPRPLTLSNEDLSKIMTDHNAFFEFNLEDSIYENINNDTAENFIGITNATALIESELHSPGKIIPLYTLEHHNLGKCFNGIVAFSSKNTPSLNTFSDLNNKKVGVINYDKIFNSAIVSYTFQSLNIKPASLYQVMLAKTTEEALQNGRLDYLLLRNYFYEKTDQEQQPIRDGFIIAGKHLTSLPCEIVYTNKNATKDWLKQIQDQLPIVIAALDQDPRIHSEININKLIPLSVQDFDEFKKIYTTGKDSIVNVEILAN